MRISFAAVRMASWSAAHPWRAIIGWFVLVAMCVSVGSLVGTHQATTADYRVGESGHAEEVAAHGGLPRQPVEFVLVGPRVGQSGARAEAAAATAASRISALPEVERVAAPVRSPDGTMLMVAITLRGEELAARDKLDSLDAQTAAIRSDYPDLRVEQTGRSSMSRGLDQQRSTDLALSEEITLPVTLVTLLIAFGSVFAAGVPVLLALSSVAASMGLAAVVSHVLPDAGVGNSMILLIGMAVGVDYSLFYLKREREERARAGGWIRPAAAVELAAATSGRAIVVSGAAVIMSTACLYLATDVLFSSLATGVITVVAVTMISSLTALPALLVKVAQRQERRKQGGAFRSRLLRVREGRMWTVLLRPATRFPLPTLILSVLVLLGMAAPAVGLNLNVPGDASFSREIPAVRAYDRLTDAFPNERVKHVVVVRSDPASSGEVIRSLAELSRRAQENPLFADQSAAGLETSPDQRVSTLELSVPYRADTAEAQNSLRVLRGELVPEVERAVPQADAAVTGVLARDADYVEDQSSKLPWVVGMLLLMTLVITVLAFRSVVLGLVGLLLNLLSAGAAFGMLVVVFQHEWAERLLEFTSTGSIGSKVPLFLFVILFGLSMDYQVFVVSRIRERVLQGMPTRQAVFEGIVGSAGVVTSAAFVMVTVFASFVMLPLVEMKQIGFGLAVAVLVDAFVVRILVLPSLLTLLGKISWWPSHTMRQAKVPGRADVPVEPGPIRVPGSSR